MREALESLLVGADQGLTIWRPQAPTGYAILGDCITLGDAQPTFQVGACTVATSLLYGGVVQSIGHGPDPPCFAPGCRSMETLLMACAQQVGCQQVLSPLALSTYTLCYL